MAAMGGPPPAPTDVELVAAVRSGDPHAFEQLYRRHLDAVRRVAYQVVGDTETSRDVVQDAFARAFQHLPELREPERFRPWLLSIARHAATDHLRARRRLTPLDDEDETLASADPSPESLAELKELTEQVEGCLAGLSHRDATAVAMVAHLGFTPDQVAGALGISPGAAKVVVHRARRRLRHALAVELIERQPSLACEEFADLLVAEDSLVASKHIEHCQLCLDAAAAEVLPFQLPSDVSAAPRPT